MKTVPVDAKRQDWPRLVANAINAFRGQTGWAVYNHGGGPQALVAATRTKMVIDAATKIESQKPNDVDALWDTATNTITGRNGDAILVKAQCVFTPTDATASIINFDVDIGGSVGIVEKQQFSVTGGAGVPVPISWTFAAYTLNTWEANGGAIYATADGPGNITEMRVVIQRTHKAR